MSASRSNPLPSGIEMSQMQISASSPGRPARLRRAAELAHHLNIGLQRQQLHKARTHNVMIVDKRHAQGHGNLRLEGKCASIPYAHTGIIDEENVLAEITGCARLPAGGITGWQAPFYSAGDGTSCFIHDATVRRGVTEATEDGVEQLDVTVRSADALLRLQLLKGAEVLRVLEELVRRPHHHRHAELFRRRHFARVPCRCVFSPIDSP